MTALTESDLRILSELKQLFESASPGELRRSLLDLYFHCRLNSPDDLPNAEELNFHFYYLIRFLNEVEEPLSNKQ